MTGRVHSIQSMGTLDGPGVRFAVFLQGCPLRCKCCHNPDTWDMCGGSEYTSRELFDRALRFKEYFGEKGGVTVSGGEPLLQPDFVREFFSLCRGEGINTCLDTSGCVLNDSVKELLSVTDRVLLDIKYTSGEMYRENVGCSIETPLLFLEYLESRHIPTTVRQVIIPTLNDGDEDILSLKKIIDSHSCVDSTELLPFRKICQVKYDQMGVPFPFAHIPQPEKELMLRLEGLLQ